jgi:hypothetical protein
VRTLRGEVVPMIADKLAALREAAEDADDWHIKLACLREFQRAAPALEALVRAAEELAASEHPGERDELRAALAELGKVLA